MGMSETTMVDFIIATGNLFYNNHFTNTDVYYVAQKASSPQDLYNKLVNTGAPSDDGTQQFAFELYGKVPHKQSKSAIAAAALAEKAQRKKELLEEAKLRKANESFKVVLEEPKSEDDEERRLRKKEKKLRKKRRQEDLSDDDTEVKTTDTRRNKASKL
jgi:hypothetical protein